VTATNELKGHCRKVNPVGVGVKMVQLTFFKFWERDHLGEDVLEGRITLKRSLKNRT
jgi:hypothetical protein